MSRIFSYYSQVQGVRGNLLGLPGWARVVLTIVALPGIVAAGLSILAFVVSLLALLVVTVPAYRLLRAIAGNGSNEAHGEPGDVRDGGFGHGPAKHVDVTIRDAPGGDASGHGLSDSDARLIE